MPVEPGISLQVTGGGSGLMNPGGGNMMSMMGGFVDTQRKIQELQLFKQTVAAKKKLGGIMATAPSMEAGLQAASQDPDISAFVPDVVQTITGNMNAMRDYSTKTYGMTKDALQSVLDILPAGMTDPTALPQIFSAKVALIPDPEIRAVVEKSGGNLIKWLAESKTPEEYASRITAVGNGTGSGEAMNKFWRQSGMINQGDKQQPVGIAPGMPTVIPNQTPNSTVPVGTPFGAGLPPQIAPQLGMQVGGMKGGAAAPNGLALPTPAKPVAAQATPASVATAPAASPGVEMSFTGRPLFGPGINMGKPPTAIKRSISGQVAGPAGQQVDALMKEFTEKGKAQYDSAQGLKGQIAEISHGYDVMAAGGGYLVPGSGADLRLALGKLKTTVKTMTGSAPDEDMTKVAFGEDMNKATQRMAANLINTMYGQQREAAETIRNITDKGVPGISNSLMGGKLILGLLDAATERSVEQYKWTNEWADKHDGDLRNADIEFNKKFPAKDYIDTALAKMGVSGTGKMSAASIEAAHRNKMLTDDQYKDLLTHKGKIFKE